MNFGALTGSLHLLVWEEQIKRFLAYFFQIFSTLSCDTFSNRRCSGHTLLRIARGCLGGRAANKKNGQLLLCQEQASALCWFPSEMFPMSKDKKEESGAKDAYQQHGMPCTVEESLLNSTGWTELTSWFDNLSKVWKGIGWLLFSPIEISQIVGFLTNLSYTRISRTLCGWSGITKVTSKKMRWVISCLPFWFIRCLSLSRSVAWQKNFGHLMTTTRLHLSAHRWRHLLEDLALTTFCNKKMFMTYLTML